LLERVIENAARAQRWVWYDEGALLERIDNGWRPSSQELSKMAAQAVGNDNPGMLKVLIGLGADPNGMDQGVPLLAEVGSVDAARVLLNAGASPCASATQAHCRFCTGFERAGALAPEVMEAMIKATAFADQPCGPVGVPPVMSAACEGNLDAVKLEQFQRAAFVQVPHLVRRDAVPAAVGAFGQQEVDRREKRSRRASVRRLDAGGRAIQLAIEAAFRMRLHPQLLDQGGGAWMHGSDQDGGDQERDNR